MQAVIMAGGKGTRLQSIASDIPKPMVSVCGKPILEYQIESLKRSNITQITIVLGHLGEIIRNYFDDGRNRGVHISYITEEEPLGTAGALYYLKNIIKDDFILVFGDLLLDVDWNRFMNFHMATNGLITLFGHPNTHPYDSDVIVVDNNSKVVKINSKEEERNFDYHNFVNAGIYCIAPRLLEIFNAPIKVDLEKQVISKQIDASMVYAYRSTEYVKDMGTPDRLDAVVRDVRSGLVVSHSLRNKQKAVFLDRDGTLNVLKGFLNNADDFELLDGVIDAIRLLNASPYLTIVATNQPVIARGECSIEELENIHKKMETLMGKEGVYVDDILYCPHHPHKGYLGEIPHLKFDCQCRKPNIGMITKAAKRYNIDLSQSWYIGDTTVDVQTGINAGMQTILLRTGEAGADAKYEVSPDYVSDNLIEAITTLLNM